MATYVPKGYHRTFASRLMVLVPPFNKPNHSTRFDPDHHAVQRNSIPRTFLDAMDTANPQRQANIDGDSTGTV